MTATEPEQRSPASPWWQSQVISTLHLGPAHKYGGEDCVLQQQHGHLALTWEQRQQQQAGNSNRAEQVPGVRSQPTNCGSGIITAQHDGTFEQ